MTSHLYWRPITSDHKRLPDMCKEALRKNPAYINSHPFWCALYAATDENSAIKEVIDYLENNPDGRIEVIVK